MQAGPPPWSRRLAHRCARRQGHSRDAHGRPACTPGFGGRSRRRHGRCRGGLCGRRRLIFLVSQGCEGIGGQWDGGGGWAPTLHVRRLIRDMHKERSISSHANTDGRRPTPIALVCIGWAGACEPAGNMSRAGGLNKPGGDSGADGGRSRGRGIGGVRASRGVGSGGGRGGGTSRSHHISRMRAQGSISGATSGTSAVCPGVPGVRMHEGREHCIIRLRQLLEEGWQLPEVGVICRGDDLDDEDGSIVAATQPVSEHNHGVRASWWGAGRGTWLEWQSFITCQGQHLLRQADTGALRRDVEELELDGGGKGTRGAYGARHQHLSAAKRHGEAT